MTMSNHVVRTTHIQRLIRNALDLAERVDGHVGGVLVEVQPDQVVDATRPAMYAVDVLEKAVADLRHAADELDAERLSCLGWRQV